ncbi:hypothetical protein [Aquimarina algicola]|uniref:PH domain-containing protein n=1 Tax=Aquimarina algicola TaxID=2589995 RepID=A0A504JDY3_9FLAO|nr:hypothetical protein [Aquimarina algicola]TPN86852.1 hypothetical protein FHK87_04415 [Aquimarina algicola]
MTKKEVDKLIKKESGMILLDKDSEDKFWEIVFKQISILTFIYALLRQKNDYLIVTEKRILFIIRNKIIENKILNGTERLTYNGIQPSFEITDLEQHYSFSLIKLRVSYKEAKLIRERLSKFINQK